jgi:hypothetical protein
MLAILAAAALVCAASLVAGRTLLVACGRREWTWLSGPVGLAALVVVAQPLVRLPGRGTTAAIVLGLALVGCLVYLRGRWDGPGLGEIAIDGLPIAAVVIAVASLPFLLNDRVGVLGEGVYTNDQAAQLYWAQWLKEGFGPEPAGVALGYPLGPQSLMAALSGGTGISLEAAFNGLLLAIPALTALAALAALSALPRGRRLVAAALVALPYLAASFLAQSGFKETAMALFLLGFALGLRELLPGTRLDPRELLPRRRAARRATAIALAVLAAATVVVFSLPGLLWPAAALAAWLAAELATGGLPLPRENISQLARRAAPFAAGGVAVLVVLALTQVGSLGNFLDRLGDVQNTGGRLTSPLSPREVLGVWPRGDFRVDVAGEPEAIAATLLGLAAAGLATWWWLRRRDLAVPAAVAGSAVIYLLTRWKGGIHVEAKALAIAAPLVMLFVTRALLDPQPRAGTARIAMPALALLFVAVAAGSTFLALRAAPVGTTDRVADLEELRPIVEGDRVLYLVPDRFSSYRLQGARVGSPGGYVPSQDVPARRAKRWDQGLPLDLDTVPNARMDRFRFAITTSAAYQSFAQKNWQPTHVTPSYTLWRRFLATPAHGVLDDEDGAPGAVLDCDDPAQRRLAQRGGTAAVIPEPVVEDAWQPSDRFVTGGAATIELSLPPGRWDLSLQYHSPVRIELNGAPGGLEERLPASLDGMFAFAPGEGPFWPAGSIDAEVGGPVELTVRQQPLTWVQDLFGVERTTWLGELAATRPGEPEEVPLEDACGRYVDWYTSSD